MNNLSVLGLQEQLDYILDLRRCHSTTYQRVWFDTPLLRQPAWQSLQTLPPAYADVLERVADWMELNLETAEDPFHGFKDYEVQRMRRDIAWMREGTDNIEQKRADFYRFFSEHDRRRNTDFLSTFPQMRQLDWAAHLHDLRPAPGMSSGEGHPLINSQWGAWLDHLKGGRKKLGRSKREDLKVIRTEAYWK
jgi:hypothetical protein